MGEELKCRLDIVFPRASIAPNYGKSNLRHSYHIQMDLTLPVTSI